MEKVHNIGLLMVTEGLLGREDLERAIRRKRREGGSLALHLVLVGAVDEASLARFYAKKLRLEPASDAMLEGIDDSLFSLVPVEIVFEGGLLPLYRQGDDVLVVGLVDPTDSELLSEASFFSGFDLVPSIITVSQMAIHFERLAGRAWRISADDARAMAPREMGSMVGEFGIDDLLEQTTVLDTQMDTVLLKGLDETYPPPTLQLDSPLAGVEPLVEPEPFDRLDGPSVWVGGRAIEEVSQIRIESVGSADESGPVVITESQLERALASTSRQPALRVDESLAHPALARVPIEPGVPDDFDLVEGEAVTSTGRVRVLGFRLDVDERDSDLDGPVPGRPVGVEPDHGFGRRPKTKIPVRPATQHQEQSVSEHLYLLTRIEEVLGFADDPIPQVIEATVDELTTVRERDVLGQTVVERLGEVYDSVALLTLNGPRAVVWRERLHGAAAPDQIGRTIDIESRGVIHRVSEEHVFYWGPLPASSPLRSAFRVTHDERVLVAPVDLRGKTVLILLLDAGGADFPSPGRYLERLLLELSRSLERVILQRRQKRRR